jgi:hypothetical protein
MDRVVRFLQTLGGASTSRVLNLGNIARASRDDPDYTARPMFRSPVVNTAFLLKHHMRPDETYLFSAVRAVATKIIIPFDLDDLRAGGRSILIEQRGFVDSLRAAGHYNSENLERDLIVLKLMNCLPSLDPFLLREHLCNNGFDVAPCYFEISAGDQARMHDYTAGEISKLIRLANGGANNNSSTDRMVSALLSSQVDEKLEPLRLTLGLSGDDFREGVFSWRGFLYYKWSMSQFWPGVMEVLREISRIRPHGAVTPAQQAFLTGTRRNVIELVRDSGKNVNKVLEIYDTSFEELVANQAPKAFRDFLLSAPYMFLDLGEQMGALSHIVSFWRHRFPPGKRVMTDAEELAVIFQDFASGFAEQEEGPALKQPVLAR